MSKYHPIFTIESPHTPVGQLSTNIDSSKVTYSNELAFAIHHYTSQEQKLFDIVISQLHLSPLYDEEVFQVSDNGESSLSECSVTFKMIREIYRYSDYRSVFIPNNIVCEYLGLGGKISRLKEVDKLLEKEITLWEKFFPGDIEEFQIEHEHHPSKGLVKPKPSTVTLKPFESIEKGNGYIKFVISSDFVPYVIGVHGFKMYSVELVRRLKLKLSLKLLKLVNYYHNNGGYMNAKHSKAFNIHEFMSLLGNLPDSFRNRPNQLINKGVKPALEEIAQVVGIKYKLETSTQSIGTKGRPSISSVRLVPLLMEENDS
ncbi:RepB family plasmid replication initiator protein [Vibrio crassostreae]|uniref:RepB family plasmid replication initiator protein n=1 Tax=Vibrio crassostreae TaxID=246167 RepID=UPI001044E637|nr:RepB family plasmid replication initiator protein [Vibrio crassostreae]TCV27414.1 replication initiator protein [Vibrio crassostreae]